MDKEAILRAIEALPRQTSEAHRSPCCGFLDPKGVSAIQVDDDYDKVEKVAVSVPAATIPDGTVMWCGGCGALLRYMGGRREIAPPFEEATRGLDLMQMAMLKKGKQINDWAIKNRPAPKEWFKKEAADAAGDDAEGPD